MAAPQRKRLAILGTRGVPARHGGFETFAERLALYLVSEGWDVTVYCQVGPKEDTPAEDRWRGVRRVNVGARGDGALGTVEFDLKATWHAAREPSVKLVLGYNTAIFNVLLRLRGRRIVMNMDGIEWKRSKWSAPARLWLRVNEYLGLLTSQRLIADHPEIERHLRAIRPHAQVTMIPYGADKAPADLPEVYLPGLDGDRFFVVVARIEPENSILEIVRAFVGSELDAQLVVLGRLEPETNEYHAEIQRIADARCLFPGAIYDPAVVTALRQRAVAYVHGHTVGGTNPSLVEALGAGAAVLAHDNPFNRWVAGEGARYFSDVATCRKEMQELLESAPRQVALRQASAARHDERFTWPAVLEAYRDLLLEQAER